MLQRTMILVGLIVLTVPAVSGETVIVNEQSNVVNQVKGGGKVNSGIEIGNAKADKSDADIDAQIEKEAGGEVEKKVIVNKKSNVVNQVNGGGKVNSGVTVNGVKKVAKTKSDPTGNGKIVTIERKVAGFGGIYVSGAFKVKVTCGAAEPMVRISGDSNLLDLIRTDVADRRLDVSASKSYTTTSPIIVEIQVPKVTGLWLEGVVEETVEKIDADQINCEMSGSCKLTLAGTVMMLRAKVEGASRLDATGLTAMRVDVNANGASQALVRPSERLKVTASGAAKVYYLGSAVMVSRSLSGAAAVTLIEESQIKDILN